MRLGVALALALAPASLFAAERLPTFPKNTPYAEARVSLRAIGWQPVEQSATFCENGECGLSRCLPGDQRCATFPEAEICRGTGQAACQFVWRRQDTVIEIRAIGEEDQTVADVRCRIGCRSGR